MGEKKRKKKEKWVRPRHAVITEAARFVLTPYVVWKYGINFEKFADQGDRPYLVLYNHQTGFDQFFVGMCFAGPVYYVATEDIFSIGWVSRLLQYAVAPIPIKKQTTDLKAVKDCAQVAREGGTIAIAPEGNRTFSGKTEYIKPSIVKMAKLLKMPIAIFRIEGGYGVQPRWSDVVRRGRMKAYVSRVIEPEEYRKLPDEEFFSMLKKELYVNEAAADQLFLHKKNAEYMERAMYVCPYCGLSEFESHDDVVECKKCGRRIQYLPSKELKGVDFEFPFRFVNDWYEYQNNFIRKLDVSPWLEKPMYRDKARLSEVIVYKNKRPILEDAVVCLYGDRITVEGEGMEMLNFDFSRTEVVTVLGKNKLNIYYGGVIYQIKGDVRFNAVKYVNIFYKFKNTEEGNGDGEFLGL